MYYPLISSMNKTSYPIVTSGLILNLDASNILSYPGSGTTWSDLTTNVNNATLYNGVGYSTSNGGVLTFDGINDYAKTVNNIGISGDANYSISLWVKFLDLSGGYRALCMLGTSASPAGKGTGLMIAGGSMIIPFYQGVASSVTYSFAINTWYNLTMTKSSGIVSSSTLKLYINGNLATISYPIITPNLLNNNFYIANDDASEISNGINIGSILVYNTTISATDVTSNFNNTKTRFGL